MPSQATTATTTRCYGPNQISAGTCLNVGGVPCRQERADPIRCQGARMCPSHFDVSPCCPVQWRSCRHSLRAAAAGTREQQQRKQQGKARHGRRLDWGARVPVWSLMRKNYPTVMGGAGNAARGWRKGNAAREERGCGKRGKGMRQEAARAAWAGGRRGVHFVHPLPLMPITKNRNRDTVMFLREHLSHQAAVAGCERCQLALIFWTVFITDLRLRRHRGSPSAFLLP